MALNSHVLYLTFALFSICCLRDSGLTGFLVIGVILLAIALLRLIYLKELYTYPTVSSYIRWFGLLWAFILIHTYLVSDNYFGWRSILIYLLPSISVILYFCTGFTISDLEGIFVQAIINSSVISLLYIGVNELPEIISGGSRIGDSASGNVNTVAINLCVYMAVILYVVTIQENKKYIPLLIILSAFILLTGSKKGVFGIFIIIMSIFALKYKYKVWKYVLPIAAILIVYYFVMNNDYFYGIIGRRLDDFFLSIENGQTNGSTGERIGMYELGWTYFKSSPIWGHGYGYFSSDSIYATYSHSNYIEMLVSFGMIGTALFYSRYIKITIDAIKGLKWNPMNILCLTLIILQYFLDSASIGYYNSSILYIVLFFTSIFSSGENLDEE